MPNYEVILCIINAGFSEVVMDTAKKLGAGGGTVIHGRGTASKEAEKIFNITIGYFQCLSCRNRTYYASCIGTAIDN